ncbi:MAG: hypothetical protein IPP71_08435 [Bacteroidetes bacterium]|nr:hypothetical protein [Bacteroidota bacterium]
MSLGGVFSITGAATSATGATSTSLYGSAFNWSIQLLVLQETVLVYR